MIAIIDYDAGNIRSVEKAVEFLGGKCRLTRDSRDIENADRVILPGVGSFGDAMSRLEQYGLDEVIRKVVSDRVPFLGICLGLQLLFESSEESPRVQGLGILKGSIRRLPSGSGLKIPDIGWNSLTFPSQGRLFEGVKEGSFVYFVHSYYLEAADRGIVKAQIEYGTAVDASVESGNTFACQFHPEKSSGTGLKILDNFINIKD